MGYLDNPAQGELRDLLRRVRQLEAGSPLGNSSITRGALRVASPEGLIVEGSEKVTGTLDITGTLTISGILNADGTITLTGPVTMTGETNLNGPTTLNGDTTQQGPFHVKGDTDITGDTALNGNMTVGAGGKIKVGGMTLDPAVSGAGTVGGISAPVTLLLSAPTVQMTSSARVDGLLNAAGGVSLTNLPTISGKTPNIYIDPADLYKLKRII